MNGTIGNILSGAGGGLPSGNPFSKLIGAPDSPGGLISLRRGMGMDPAPPGGPGRTQPSVLQKFIDMTSAPSETPQTAAAPELPASRGGAQVDPQIVSGIRATADALGIDPVDLATAISYETEGTFDPVKRGPTTKWGQHRGLIQFGEPQARQYGVDWNNPVASQLGPEGAIAKYLRASGVKPGMGLLDVYSAINAGAPGLYDRSDTAAGGAPGTVRDKVEQQMAGHRRKAEALMGGPMDPFSVQSRILDRLKPPQSDDTGSFDWSPQDRQSAQPPETPPPAELPEHPDAMQGRIPPNIDLDNLPFQVVVDDITKRGTTETLRDLSPGATIGVIRELGRRARETSRPI